MLVHVSGIVPGMAGLSRAELGPTGRSQPYRETQHEQNGTDHGCIWLKPYHPGTAYFVRLFGLFVSPWFESGSNVVLKHWGTEASLQGTR